MGLENILTKSNRRFVAFDGKVVIMEYRDSPGKASG